MKLGVANLILLISFSVQGSTPDYYTVEEFEPQNFNRGLAQGSATESSATSMNPLDTFSAVMKASTLKSFDLDLNLMSWQHHDEELEDPAIPYDRKNQYGTWVRDPRENNCYNTRVRVLIRTSEVPVSFTDNGCNVVSGQWYDPYSDQQYTEARDLQIDHVVPLKNSYVSGAWKWDGNKRCLFANFTSNDFHLLPVNGHENMKKRDKTPEDFMPSNVNFACHYLSIWLKIKLIWNLAMTPSEAQAISELVKQNQCDESLLLMTADELSKQRESILENMSLCRASQ